MTQALKLPGATLTIVTIDLEVMIIIGSPKRMLVQHKGAGLDQYIKYT